MALLVGAVLAAVVLARKRQHRRRAIPTDFDEQIQRLEESGEIPALPIRRKPREIDRKHVKVIEKIGEGAFGEVRISEERTPSFGSTMGVFASTT